jgi:signal transduction histidine kinase
MPIDPELLDQLRVCSRDKAALERLVQLFEAHTAPAEALAQQQDLYALYLLSLNLTSITDLDKLCHQTVRQGLATLRFDRLALFLIDHPRGLLISTYGTDMQGNVRDEHRYEAPLAEMTWLDEVNNAPDHVQMWADAPLYDWDAVVGTGWKISAALWDGQQVLGYLLADNFVNQQPPRPYERLLFSLYGSMVGRLISLCYANTALRHTQELLQSTEELARIGSWELDPATMQPYWTEQVYRIHGVPIGTPINVANAINFYAPSARPVIQSVIEQAIQHGTAWDVELPFINAQGEELWVRVVGRARYENDTITRLYGFFQDITLQRQAQQQALELALEREKVHLLQRFLQDMSHDFRTPFTTQQNALYLINYYVEKLNEQMLALQQYASGRLPLQAQATLTACAELSKSILQQGAVLKSSGKRAVKLVDQLLDMARSEHTNALNRHMCDLNALISQTVAIYQPLITPQQLSLSFLPTPELPAVLLDEDAFGRVVHNLLDNAIQYTPAKGTIVLRTAYDDQHIILEVQDSGIGIAEEDLPHIFKRFYRVDKARASHSGGSGLGLAIVKQIVEAHGGTVSASSQLGKGTTFTVSLPAADQHSAGVGSTANKGVLG